MRQTQDTTEAASNGLLIPGIIVKAVSMRLISLLFACLPIVRPAFSQQITHHEVAIGVAASTDRPLGGVPGFENSFQRGVFASPEGRYTLNLNRNVAVESVLSDSVDLERTEEREGGHQLLALAGVKAGVRFGRFGVFGTSAAGVASFSRGQGTYIPPATIQYQRVSHFAIHEGAALEFSVTPRVFLRFDVGELLNTEFRRDFYRSARIAETSFATVPYHLTTSFTIARRFGGLQELAAPGDRPKTSGYSIGGLYALGIQEHLLLNDVRATGGGGAWSGFPLWRFVSGDVVAFDEPHDDHTANAQDGGTIFAAFAGPKIGFRKGPFGIYAKARPGIKRYSRTEVFLRLAPESIESQRHPKVDFALDTGLVLEYTPPRHGLRHTVARFEGGSTYDHYRGTYLTEQDAFRNFQMPPHAYYYPPQRHSSLLFLAGIGFSF